MACIVFHAIWQSIPNADPERADPQNVLAAIMASAWPLPFSAPLECDGQRPSDTIVGFATAELPAIGKADGGVAGDIEVQSGLDHASNNELEKSMAAWRLNTLANRSDVFRAVPI